MVIYEDEDEDEDEDELPESEVQLTYPLDDLTALLLADLKAAKGDWEGITAALQRSVLRMQQSLYELRTHYGLEDEEGDDSVH